MPVPKPSHISSKIWASQGTVEVPEDAKINSGWTLEVPKFQVENWVQNRSDQFAGHVNERGIPEWDATTDYLEGKSYVQGSDGKVYLAKVNSGPSTSVQNPATDTLESYWAESFASKSSVSGLPERVNALEDFQSSATTRIEDLEAFPGKLASTSDTLGASLVNWKGKTVGQSLDQVFQGIAYVEDYGVIGSSPGSMVDDTNAFLAACNDCRAKGLRLIVGKKKIYLPTITSPINLDGFAIEGTGDVLYVPMDDWGVPRGLHDETAYLLNDALNQQCAVFIHTGYNGALFTGKAFNARNIGILGKFSFANNRGFEQTTPTSYPGWSQALQGTDQVVIAYTGSDGILLKGGLEVLDIGRIDTKFCGGNGLRVTTTAGIDSPVEYLKFTKGRMISSRNENIYLEGVRKHIDFGAMVLNDPGMIRLRMGGGVGAPSTSAPVSEESLTAAVRMDFNGAATVYGIRLDGIVAEYCNLIVRTTGVFARGIEVKNSTLFPAYEAGWIWRMGIMGHVNTVDGVFMHNYGNLNSHASFVFNNHGPESIIQVDSITRIAGLQARQVQRFLSTDPRTGTIGDGSAGAFTDATVVSPLERPAANSSGFSQMFIISATFQGTSGNGAGAYLLLITRGAGGDYIGISFQGSSVTGFSAPPTVNPTTGAITVNLSQFYRARISRIDHGELSSLNLSL